jgi:hypothetical protein
MPESDFLLTQQICNYSGFRVFDRSRLFQEAGNTMTKSQEIPYTKQLHFE